MTTDTSPTSGLSRKQIAFSVIVATAAVVSLYLLLPSIAGFDNTWRRLEDGRPGWLGLAVLFEVASYVSYVALFRTVLARPPVSLGWRESAVITMAGVAATRLLASGGAGGVALTAWALKRSGAEGRLVAVRMTAFLVLLYGIFMAVLVIFGLGLYFGILAHPQPLAMTLIPAGFGAFVIATALATTVIPRDLAARMEEGTLKRRLAAAATAIADGVREALYLARTFNPGLAAALGWWAFDIGALWACLQAFGGAPNAAIVVLGYFVGMLGNLLPLPGGIGGVDAGMIGALLAFDVAGGLAIAGVLAYRAIAFWLPTIPGVLAYVKLVGYVRSWRTASD